MVVAIDADVVEALRAKFEAVLPHLDERQPAAGDGRRGPVVWVMAGSPRWLVATGASRSRISAGGGRVGGRRRRRWDGSGGAGGGRKPVTDDRSGPGRGAAGAGGTDPTGRSGIGVVLDDVVDPQARGRTDRGRASGGVGHGRPGCCTSRATACRPTPRPSRAASTPTGTPSSATSTTRPPQHLAAGDPVISVDTKKKELVGDYKNGGREWRPAGRPRAGQGPRLHRPSTGQGQPLRGLRPGRQHRLGDGGHRPRHRRVRRRTPSAAGGTPWAPTPTPTPPGC